VGEAAVRVSAGVSAEELFFLAAGFFVGDAVVFSDVVAAVFFERAAGFSAGVSDVVEAFFGVEASDESDG
jgi:hypothetical protein